MAELEKKPVIHLSRKTMISITYYLYLKFRKIIKAITVDKLITLFFYLLIFFTPFQISKHFYSPSSYFSGYVIDYFLPTIFFHDFLILLIISLTFLNWSTFIKGVKTNYACLLFLIWEIAIILTTLPYFHEFPIILKFIRISEFNLLALILIARKDLFKNLDRISRLIIISSFLAALIVIGEFFVQHSINFGLLAEWKFTSIDDGLAYFYLNGDRIIRPRGTFPHPNIASFYLLIGSMFTIYSSFKKRQKILVPIFLIISLGLLLTFSRLHLTTYFLGLVLFLVYFLVFDNGLSLIKKNKKLMPLLLVGVILITIIILPSLWNRFSSLLTTDYTSLNRRYFLNQESFFMIKNNFYQGVGLNNFIKNINPNYAGYSYFFLQPVHNLFLLVFSELGLIGLLPFLFMIFYGFIIQVIRFIKNWSSTKHLLIIILWICFFVSALWDHFFWSTYQGNIMLYFLFWLSFSYQEN